MKVFVLEDDPMRVRYLRERLFKHDLTIVDTCKDAGKFNPPYDLILLDHDLGGRQYEEHEDDGTAFVELIRDKVNPDAIVAIHSYNVEGTIRMAGRIHAHIAPFRGSEFERILLMAENEDDKT